MKLKILKDLILTQKKKKKRFDFIQKDLFITNPN